MRNNIYRLNKNSEIGITLVALIITIIVLLIMAGITFTQVLGDNGILERAKKAGEEEQKASTKEKIELAIQTLTIKHVGNSNEITAEELQAELGEDYSVVSGDRYSIINLKDNTKYKVSNNWTVSYYEEDNSILVSKNGGMNNPVVISENGIHNFNLSYEDGQDIEILRY